MNSSALTKDQTLNLLNLLLEAERAGARAVEKLSSQAADPAGAETLRKIAQDEGFFCNMLSQHIIRLGGQLSKKTGEFYDKVMALDSFEDRLDLLDRGQGWVVRKIQEALPSLEDKALYDDLLNMLEVHVVNIEKAAVLPLKN